MNRLMESVPSSAGEVVIGNTAVAESLIGVFVAMVLVITFRRKTHKAIELAVWIGLIWSCLIAVTGIRDPQTHALTTSAAWGTTQVVGTIAGAFKVDALHWTYGARFLIAEWVLLLLGVNVLALALVSTNRQAGARMPATKLREWWVLPRLPVSQPVGAPSAVDEINRRFNRWSELAATAAAVWATLFLIWLRDVELPIVAGGVKNISVEAGASLWRVAGWKRQPITKSGSFGGDMVPTNSLATTADTGVVHVGIAKRTPKTRITAPDARIESNGSKKHRQSRLAS